MAESTQNNVGNENTSGAANTPAPRKSVSLKRGSSDEDIKKAYAAGDISYYQISQAVFESTSDESVTKVRNIIEGSGSDTE